MKLEIRKEHINYKHRCDTQKCVLACAINDILKPGFQVSVDSEYFEIWEAKNGVLMTALTEEPLQLMKDAQKIVERFDNEEGRCKPISPCTVTIADIPEKYLKSEKTENVEEEES